MQSLRELYKIGRGPSSSHTLAPERACCLFTEVNGAFPYYIIDLYGSLSLTGKGHNTDGIIKDTLPGEVVVNFHEDWTESFPNGFYLHACNEQHQIVLTWTIFSLGGGSIDIKEYELNWDDEIYEETSFRQILDIITEQKQTLLDYIYQRETGLEAFLERILDAEIACVEHGLQAEGQLPGKLQMKRSAKELYEQAKTCTGSEQERLYLIAYAYAAAEENGAGQTCVTAPTLGACGVMASLMYYYAKNVGTPKEELIHALAIGGLFGNLIKQNATISGALGGCQAEIGTAVSMASAACAYLEGLNVNQIEYAAEIGMEHNLGLTCDPVMGYVMIPCIERNSMGILRARDAALLSKHMSQVKEHIVSFDMVVQTMNETGKQIPISLKETSKGGLAVAFDQKDE